MSSIVNETMNVWAGNPRDEYFGYTASNPLLQIKWTPSLLLTFDDILLQVAFAV